MLSPALFISSRVSSQSLRSPILTHACRRAYATKPNPPLLGRYTTIPYELFRINASKKVILRNFEDQKKLGRSSYDLVVQEDGLVHPRPGDTFDGTSRSCMCMFEQGLRGRMDVGPNGASVRPDGAMMQEVVRNFRGKNTTIYRILPGTHAHPFSHLSTNSD